MNPVRIFMMLIGLVACLYSQPAVGDFYYRINPKEAAPGQSVTFEVFEFNMCLYDYDVTYEWVPTPISSKWTTIISLKADRKPKCALASGYSGPKVRLEDLEVGVRAGKRKEEPGWHRMDGREISSPR